MSDIDTLRRFYVLKRMDARRLDDTALSTVWQFKQENEPGTVLPATFPSRAQLAAVGYTTDTDLQGADVEELQEYASLNQREAEAVLAALAAL